MKLSLLICIAAVIMTSLVYVERQRFSEAANAMPPSSTIQSYEVDQIIRECPKHLRVALVLGTGSMLEIRGKNPKQATALAIYDPLFKFDLLSTGTFVLFEHYLIGLVVHQLVQVDGEGWISTGSANSHYDSGQVTRKNLRGVVVKIYNISAPEVSP